jgi:hypothetical protein
MNTKFCRKISKGKRPLGISKHKWEDNIKRAFEESESEDVNLIQLGHYKDFTDQLHIHNQLLKKGPAPYT